MVVSAPLAMPGSALVCRAAVSLAQSPGACGAMLTAAQHICDAGRLRTLALLRALSNLRAAYYQPGGAGGASAGGKRKRSTPGAGSGVGYGGSAGAPTKAQKAALAKAQAEATKYRGRKPSFTRDQFGTVRDMLAQGAGVSVIAKATGLSRQTVYRIEADPAEQEAALARWGGGRG